MKVIRYVRPKWACSHYEGSGDENHPGQYSASGENQFIRYIYHPSRESGIPAAYLKGYSGYIQTDAYAGYNRAVESEDITHVLCLAHARRKFNEATKGKGGSPVVREFVSIIQRIFRVEKELRNKDLSDEIFISQRKEQTVLFFEKLEKQLEKKFHRLLLHRLWARQLHTL